MRLKEALVKAGKIPVSDNKRGRPSAQYKAWAQELVDSQGYVIDGFTKTGSSSSTPATAKPTRAVPKSDSTGIVDIPDERRSETLWRAEAGGKKIGMRTVCNGCGGSLTYCYCPTSRVWLDFDTEGPVTFIATKGDR